ncbi:patatin-like phospholipase family protein [Sorangium sp. So ce1000]|uniref:patatin-like phospholipase family protein n=1 Tax=Sorangium sp. So ce1000 TaxID=3133325 RepID=UPI003F62DEA2
MPLNLVLEGGGVKGIALVGAVVALAEQGHEFRRFAGTSAGAIVAALLSAKYTPDEVLNLIAGPDIAKFADPVGRVPILGSALGLLTRLGIYKGDYFLEFIRARLRDKGVKTFGDLVDGEYVRLARRAGVTPDPRWKYKAHFVVSDVTRGRMLIVPDDIDERRYGVDPDHLEVALAVRMSMSIPFVFSPVSLRGLNGATSHIVDGGLLSNFPLQIFDPSLPREWQDELLRCPDLRHYMGAGRVDYGPGAPSDPRCAEVMDRCRPLLEYQSAPVTLGVRLLQGKPHEIRPPFLASRLAYALIRTAVEAHDLTTIRRYEELNYARTLHINTESVPITRFNLTPMQKEMLYSTGYDAMERFLRHNGLEGLTRASRAESLRANAMAAERAGEGAHSGPP